MKKPFWVFLPAVIFLAACSSPISVDFIPVHKAGETGLYELTQFDQYSETNETVTSTIVTHLEMKVEDEVTLVNPDGTVDFNVRYKKIHALYEVSGKGNFDGDSDALPGPNPMNESFARMKRQKIQVRQDKKGHLISVSGADSLFYGMFADSLYSGDDALKEILEAEAFFPDSAVKQGEKWMRKHSQKSYYPVIFWDTLQITEINDSLIKVEFYSSVTTNPESKQVYDEGGQAVDFEMQGNRSGAYWVNRKNFMVESSSTKMDLKGMKKIISTGKTIPVVVSRTEKAVYRKNQGL